MIAHVSGLPVEELLPTLLSGSGAFLLLLTSLWTRRRSIRGDHEPTVDETSARG